MSVLIGMIARETARFSQCYASVIGMDKPEGSEFMLYTGYNTPQGWNQIAERLLESSHEWVFTTNDDHIYPPDTIPRLMRHGKECVTGLYLLRQFPFEPVIYDYVNADGLMGHRFLDDGASGLVPIKVCGDGALLTHRSVFERVPRPWYQLNGPPAPLDQINCDILFCQKLRANGVELWCDLDVRVSHIACVPIRPMERGGRWYTQLEQGNGGAIELPAARQGDRQRMEAELAAQKARQAGGGS